MCDVCFLPTLRKTGLHIYINHIYIPPYHQLPPTGLQSSGVEAAMLTSHQDYETEGRGIMDKLFRLAAFGAWRA